jgi:uncharacterized damage-inducible protein DinB
MTSRINLDGKSMNLSAQIAKLLRAVYFGGNWCDVNLKDTLADVNWQQATAKVYSFNSIAALVYHMNYYVTAILKVLQGGPLDAHDKYSYDLPSIQSQQDWEKLLDKFWNDAENFASLVEQLPDTKFEEIFSDEKYGNYYRNIHGVIEHLHYHLGQIVLIKKMISQPDKK